MSLSAGILPFNLSSGRLAQRLHSLCALLSIEVKPVRVRSPTFPTYLSIFISASNLLRISAFSSGLSEWHCEWITSVLAFIHLEHNH